MNFISTYSKLLKHFIYARFLLIEGYKQGALRKELTIAPFVERFKAGTLRKLPDESHQYLLQIA